jgi:hypothetical protein
MVYGHIIILYAHIYHNIIMIWMGIYGWTLIFNTPFILWSGLHLSDTKTKRR